ncbi:Phosphatidylinositol phosphatase PTPRQ-like [Oopsacas minuta]|uniref:Phosphatidylinositol phosphatase PTPRQ-like n=1 Tax=Oopsacas minuta TaxID=111878 RepID=A0AAV7KHZ3_9METZ|nr:Phosphatidylinositol phosphatase PTPRQ-like [Oopsacas minuta]
MRIYRILLFALLVHFAEVLTSADSSILSCDLILNGYCYEHFTQKSNWTDANSSCVDWGGELVSLYTQTLTDFLPYLISINTVWTSANNLQTNNFTLVWSNGSEVDLLPADTNITEFACGYVSVSGGFNISICNTTRSYICTKEVILIPSSAPGNLNVTATNSTSILISWIPPQYPSYTQQQQQQRDEQLTSYILVIISGLEPDRNEMEYELPTDTQSFRVTGLEEGTHYTIQISAATRAGIGPVNSSSVFTPESVPTGEVLNLTVIEVDSRGMFVSWSPPAVSLQNGEINGYRIVMRRDSTVVLNITTTSVCYSISDLYPHINYSVSVSPINSEGEGPSLSIYQYTESEVPSSSVRNLTTSTTSQNATSIFVSWIVPIPNDLNGILVNYSISYFGIEIDTTLRVIYLSDPDDNESITLIDLQEYTTYSISVAAYTIVGKGPDAIITQRTNQDAPSSIPTSLQATPLSPTILSITWEDPVYINQNGIITTYILTYEGIERDTQLRTLTLPQTNLSLTCHNLDSLEEYTTYKISVSASTTVGAGPVSRVTVRTLENVPSSTVRNLTAEPSSSSITVGWYEPIMNDLNGVPTYYTLRYSGVEFQTEEKTVVVNYTSSGNETVTLTGLEAYTVYEISVTLSTSIGEGDPANIDIRTLETVPTGTPTDLNTNVLSANIISVTWGHPISIEQNGVITEYTLTYRGVERDTTSREVTLYSNDTFFTNYILSQLDEHTNYNISVSASTSVGTGPASSLQTLTDQNVPSSTVRSLTAVPSASSITVSWNEPIMDDFNGVPTYYTLRYSGVEFQTEEKTVVVNYTSSGNEMVSLTGLEAYTVYEISVTLSTSIGEGDPANIDIRTLETVPTGTPTDLNTNVLSANIISVTWGHPISIEQNGVITEYTLTYRGVERDTASREIILLSNEPYFTSYVITQLDEHTTYDIDVAASTMIGIGPIASIRTITDQDVPSAAPNNVATSVVNSTAILLTWDAPDLSDRNGILLYYTLTYFGVELDQIVRVVNYTIEGSNHSNQTYEFSGLQEYTVYEFRVAAHTSLGEGVTASASARTDESVPTTQPSELNVQILSSSILIATWYEPPFSEQNGILTKYRVTWRGLERDTEVRLEDIPVSSTSNTSYALTDLDAYTSYEVNVSSFTSVGAGPISSYTVTTLQDIPSSSVRNLTTSTTSQNATSIFVSWIIPIPNDLNGILVNYSISYFGIEIDTTLRVIYLSDPNDNESITLIDLQEYTTYSISVAAYTIVGKGPDAIITQRTNQDAPSSIPTSLQATPLSPTILSITWEDPVYINQNGIITTYTLTYEGIERDTQLRTLTLPQTNLSLTCHNLDSLEEYTTYKISVSASTTVGAGPVSRVTVRTLENVPSSTVRSLTAVPSASSITVSWNEPIMDDFNGVPTYYTLRYSGVRFQTEEKIVVVNYTSSGNEMVSLTGLEAYTVYEISVTLSTSIGEGDPANIDIRTLETVPTGTPTDLNTNVLSANIISVTWGHPISIEQNGVITEYTLTYRGVERDTESREIILLSNEPYFTSYVITQLDEHTTYDIDVAASTMIGIGPIASIRTITDQDVPSAAPNNVATSVVNSTAILLTWDAPDLSDRNGILLYYTLTYFGVELDQIVRVVNYTIEGSNHSNQTYEFSGLQEYTVYEFRVAAHTSLGEGVTASVSTRTYESVPTAQPSNLNVQILSSSILIATWYEPPFSEQNGILTKYRVTWRGLERDTEVRLEDIPVNSTSNTSYALTDLDAYTSYEVNVSSFTSVGAGPISSYTVTTLQDIPSSSVRNLTTSTTSQNATSIFVSWIVPIQNDLNGILVNYSISYFGIEIDTTLRVIYLSDPNDNESITLIDLQEYTTYSISVAAYTIVGKGPDAIITQRTNQDVPTDIPTSFSANAISPNIINTTWEPPTAYHLGGVITSYTLTYAGRERHSLLKTIILTVLNGSIYITPALTDLQEDTHYLISVRANTSVGAGPWTSLTVHTPEDVPSSSVRNLTTSTEDQNATSIFVSWEVPILNDLNGILVNYSINYSGIEIDTVPRVIYLSYPNLTNQSITLIDLEEYTTYSINVSAYTIVGKGPDAIITQRTNQDVPSAFPTNFLLKAISPTIVKVSWDPPPINDQNGVITTYTLTYMGLERDQELETMIITVLNGTYVLPILIGLEENTNYFVTLNANTSEGAGPITNLSVLTLQNIPKGAPRNLILTSTDTSIQINWSVPIIDDLDGNLTGYLVTYHGFEIDTHERMIQFNTSSDDNQTLTLSPLEEYTDYFISVHAITVGVGPSLSTTFRTLQARPSAVPTDLTASPISARAIYITWSPPPFIHQNGIITEYTLTYQGVERDIMKRNISIPTATSRSTTSLTVTDIEEDTDFTIAIRAHTIKGPGPITTVSVRTLESEPSSPVRDLTTSTTRQNATSIFVNWEVPILNDLNGILVNYSINYSGIEIDTAPRVIYLSYPNLTNQSITLIDLQEYTTYSINVSAYTKVGKGPDAIITQRTNQDVPSGPPLNLTAFPISPTDILAEWKVPDTYEQNGIIVLFTIIFSSLNSDAHDDIKRTLPVSDNSTKFCFLLSGLEEGTTYSIRVSASTSVGEGPFSNTQASTFNTGPTRAPRNFFAYEITAISISVSWDAPEDEDINGILDRYELTYSGKDLDTHLHVEYFEDNLYHLQTAELTNLQENTIYTIQVYLFSSGIRSPPATMIVNTLQSAPNETVQYLNTTEASPFATLITWEPPPFPFQNGPIISYEILTVFSDPYTNVTGLSRNFTWLNYTDSTEILLKELRPGVNFSSTVIPINQEGSGPPISTIFSMIAETIPEILIPESDVFITVQEAVVDEFSRYYECVASGNPIPLIHWIRNDETRLDAFNITINGTSLVRGSNIFRCVASSRNGEDSLVVSVILVSEEIDVSAISDTQELVSNQTSLNEEETDDLSSLIRTSVQSVDSNRMNNSANSTNSNSTANSTEIVDAVSGLYSDVIRLTEMGISRNTSVNLFSTGGELVRASQNDQGIAENQEIPSLSGNICLFPLQNVTNTYRALAISVNGIEDLGIKFIENLNTTEPSVIDDPESSIFFEAQELNETVYDNSTMTFPMTNRTTNSSEQVSVPGSLLQALMNSSNNSGIAPRITISTTFIGEKQENISRILVFSIQERNSTKLIEFFGNSVSYLGNYSI